MLAKRFEHILHDLGMAGLEHPLFYHAPVGIRFKIGGEEPIYLDRRAAKLKTNPAYVQGALDRAAAIYRALPAVPDLLRIDGYPDEEPAVVGTERFAPKPLHLDEALMQLESIGSEFLVFINAETDRVNVVYRRRIGGYAVIDPVL